MENADFYKPVLNKIMGIIHNIQFRSSFKRTAINTNTLDISLHNIYEGWKIWFKYMPTSDRVMVFSAMSLLGLQSIFIYVGRVLLNPTTTDPPTTYPPTHRPNESIIIFKRLENRTIFISQNIYAAEKIISVCHLFDG